MKAYVLFLLALMPLFSSTSEGTCGPEPITDPEDAAFCSDDLEIVFEEVGDFSCSIFPSCDGLTDKVMKQLGLPAIKYKKAKKDSWYTVMIVDPDAPSRTNPQSQYWRHFLAVDVKGQDLQNGIIHLENILTGYNRPGPPPGTGLHRYQALVYLQKVGTSPQLLAQEEYRGRWNVAAFAARNALVGPVAANQFMVQNPKQ